MLGLASTIPIASLSTVATTVVSYHPDRVVMIETNGPATSRERMRIHADGTVSIGTPSTESRTC